ncbi:MAG: cyclic nucleotide-binding/CBS domain-containing protein [Desulfarculus sp.]|nr:cyclic nucleotide-binding/CBS domain-containing protein [Desulfarculus sp.]
MTEAAFPRVLEFVRKVVPFDTLPAEELEAAVEQMEIAYFPRGQVVIEAGGEPAQFLYVIQTGSAKISLPQKDGEDILVDQRGEGEYFGAVSLLQGSRALFRVTAREDLICYLLSGDAFRDLVARHPSLERHFGFGLARNLQAMRTAGQDPAGGLLDGAGLDASLVQGRVAEVMTKDVLTCLPATPVKAAAHLMMVRRVGSVVVVEESGHPLGILTDSDLRSRVLAQGRSAGRPVLEFMSQPVHALGPESHIFEALLAMSTHGVNHLVVTEQDRVVGLISDHDLRGLTGSSPVTVVRDIEKVANLDDLVLVHKKVDRVLEMLLRQGGNAPTMLALVTEFNDRLTIKLLELVEGQMEHSGLGRPPVPYVWMALGSEGRREQTLRTDQDNALIFANLPPERLEAVQRWFLGFAGRVVAGLEACGFPRCLGEVMANNPRWCQPERQWQETFLRWIQDPEPLSLRLATIFFDFRAIYAEADFIENLQQKLKEGLEGNRLFLRYMAKNALYNRPPLGFLRQFVVEKSGEHKNKLNLKLSGLTPMVDAVRVMALDLGLVITNTLERLEAVAQAGLIKPSLAADLKEAFSFMTILRIGRHLEARARGEVPDNFVDPAALSGLQRKMLKESFGVISQLQDLMEYRYQARMVQG